MRDLPIISSDWLSELAGMDLAIQALKRQLEVWASNRMDGVKIGKGFTLEMTVITETEIKYYMGEMAV